MNERGRHKRGSGGSFGTFKQRRTVDKVKLAAWIKLPAEIKEEKYKWSFEDFCNE